MWSLASEAPGALLTNVGSWNLHPSQAPCDSAVDQHRGTTDLESAHLESQPQVNPTWSLSCQPSEETALLPAQHPLHPEISHLAVNRSGSDSGAVSGLLITGCAQAINLPRWCLHLQDGSKCQALPPAIE